MPRTDEKKIYKKVLKNGLTVLVRPNHQVPKVSVQLWYNVGSKDEKTGEKGIAHLIEHMIFKGTEKLSESDINMITHKLSGSCNAFTSHDYTGYLFDFPSHHWQEALPIMADCMRGCTFKEELLSSEMKAVIQELKMYRDNYPSTLVDEMLSAIFIDHPYHYPVIGFKQDLWNLKRDALINFYEKHYVPNNATLVVVGDVEPEEVFRDAQKHFGSIEPNWEYKRDEYYFSPDIISKGVTLYRDVQQPVVMLANIVPGATQKMDYVLDVLSWILGLGKGSRLHKKLVEELQLATTVEAFSYDLFDHAPFFIYFCPKNVEDIEKIIQIIQDEIQSIIDNGLTDEEVQRATKQAETAYLSVLEDNQKQAYAIGQAYTATQDENFLFNYLNYPMGQLRGAIKDLLSTYMRSSLMHKGMILPIKAEDKDYWQFVQKRSDEEDARVLSGVQREAKVEEGAQVHQVKTQSPKPFTFPRAEKFVLPNGLTVLYHHNPNVPMIEMGLSLKAKHFYDPENLQGVNAFMSEMLVQGTKNYSAIELADAVESRGMSLNVSPGSIWMSTLSKDFERGLELFNEVLTQPAFKQEEMGKVRSNMLVNLKQYWDNPSAFVGQLAREQVYKNHPYSKKPFGDFESIEKIQHDDVLAAFKNYITPKGAVLSIVGDIEQYDVKKVIEKTIGEWSGPEVASLDFPLLKPLNFEEVIYPIARDQIVLAYTGLSIARTDEQYDKMFLFDQVLTGGVLGSMSSRLFALREQSGLFYTVSGSILSGADEQPGKVFIKTIVSLDRLAEAEKALEHTINHAADSLHSEELEQAKNAVANTLVNNFASNSNIAHTLIFIERFGLPADYFDHRAAQLFNISGEAILEGVKPFLDTQKMAKIKIGRL